MESKSDINSDIEALVAEDNRRFLSTLARSIILSEGDFSLILVRCNYVFLREKMWQQIQQLAPQPLDHLLLKDDQANLYQAITEFRRRKKIYCLHIFGTEIVDNLEQILVSANQMRDEFNQSFNFPLVLWMTDDGLQKMTRLAADFKSWATSAIKFNLETEKLVVLWHRAADRLFDQILETQGEIFLANQSLGLASGDRHRQELESALLDLEERGFSLEPGLLATWQLIQGRDADANNQFSEAIAYYEKSLEFWQQSPQPTEFPEPELLASYFSLHLERQGVLLLHLGLSYAKQAQLDLGRNSNLWEKAKISFQTGVVAFHAAGQSKLAAQLLIYQGEVLQSLQQWQELAALAEGALTRSAIVDSPLYLAQVYGFLATVAHAQQDWLQVTELIQIALDTLEQKNLVSRNTSFYLLLLAKSQRWSKQQSIALYTLQQAKKIAEKTTHQSLNWLENYLEILEELRSVYWEMQQYLAAFGIKQQQYLVEQQYGIKTFIGASPLPLRLVNQDSNYLTAPLLASARERDVKAIINRLVRADNKLTIIHGASGVGKTSLINGGLVPALHHKIVGSRITIPITQRNYRDWQTNLSAAILTMISQGQTQFLKEVRETQEVQNPELIDLVRKSSQDNFLLVLIFDQFEDFFSGGVPAQDKWNFYEFLVACLTTSFVKIILSIREDALHRLLECDRYINLDIINNNILDREIRYPLGDLSSEEARELIQNLTTLSRWQLEPSLIEAFVQDLATDSGMVRLIELQVLGATLQAEKITTLKAYKNLGTNSRSALIELHLDRIITDCGTENQGITWQILFHLTDDIQNIRPIKTFSELLDLVVRSSIVSTEELVDSLSDQALWASISGLKIELILSILVGSGLVLKVAEMSVQGYQLAYDYLSKPIRQRYLQDLQSSITTKLFDQAQELRLIRQQKFRAIAISLGMGVLASAAILLAGIAESQRQIATNLSINSQLSALSASSEALFAAGKQFDALLEAVRGAEQLQRYQNRDQKNIAVDTRMQIIITLQQSFSQIKERNRLEGHLDIISHVIFSPDGNLIASASRDKTIKLWRLDGKNVATITGHGDSVVSLSFSPNGRFLASASWDGTVKIWEIIPNTASPSEESQEKVAWKLIRTIESGSPRVVSVSFSPDGQKLALGLQNQVIQIWTITGELLKSWRGQVGEVTSVGFSPEGRSIAASGNRGVVTVWSIAGELQQTLSSHQGKVNSVVFSPDGTLIATAGDDRTLKLWDRQGLLLQTLTRNQGWVMYAAFSPDSQLLVSAEQSGFLRVWRRDGTLIESLKAHSDRINAATFSPRGEMIVSASEDKTVKLWLSPQPLQEKPNAHDQPIRDIKFSPDGQRLASASDDHTVRLWQVAGLSDNPANNPVNNQGYSLKSPPMILKGHSNRITSIAFAPDGSLASASRDGSVRFWSATGQALGVIQEKDWVLRVIFSPEGQLIATASRDHTVKLWDRQGNLVNTLRGHSDRVNAVIFSPDGQVIASASDDQTVKLWTREGKLLTTLQGHQAWVLDLAFSSNGDYLATAGYDNRVNIWSRRGELVKTLKGSSDSVARVNFLGNNQIIATTSWNNQVQLWRLDDTLIKTLSGHSDRITSIDWRGDGNALVTASQDGSIILWNLNLENLLHNSCSWLRDYLENNSQVRDSDRQLCKP